MGIKISQYRERIDELFKTGRVRTYQKNQLIHYDGDILTQIYEITDGYIKAYTILDSGDTRTIFLLGPGDIFPLAFSDTMDWKDYRIKYFYQTLNEVKLKVMDWESFAVALETDRRKMRSYLAYLSAVNQAIANQLEVMKNKKAINKVELLLPYLAIKLGEKSGPGKYKLHLKLSHQEIADLSGVTRETTTTLVKQLERRGVIKQDSGHWLIRMDKLEGSPFEEN